MFLRKLCVIVLPLVMAALLCLVQPLMEGIPFWTEAFQGLTLGVPLTTLIIVVLSQYLAVIGIEVPVLNMLKTGSGNVILVECAFIGFLAVQMIRTRK